MLIQYLIDTHLKIFPIQLIDLEQYTKAMQYNTQSLIYNVLNQV